jgi:HEAT repeat protein
MQELESCLESPSYKLRLTALRGLYNLKSPTAGSACLKCLADWNPEVRRTAVTFLGLQKSPAAAPALAVLLRDENVDVRVAAARALEAFCSEQTVYMLIRALEDEEISVRTAAKAALVRTLSVPLNIDVDQEPDVLFPKVETLLQWWSKARAEGLPWSVPDYLRCKTPQLVNE